MSRNQTNFDDMFGKELQGDNMAGIKRATKPFGTRVGHYIAQAFVIVYALISLFFLLVQAMFVVLVRGPSYVGWVHPSQCRDFNSWMSAEWRYYGRGGMQVGTRRFGLEVARKGYLGIRHPLI